MKLSLLSALTATLAASLVAASAPATVNLRIEAQSRTVFEGQVTTTGHDITTSSGGTHACDASSTTGVPSANVLSALDDAAEQGHYTWDGPFNADAFSFDVARITNATSTSNQYEHWAYSLDYSEVNTGGCGAAVQNGSSIVFVQTTNASSPLNFLDLSGPETVTAGKPFKVLVRQGNTAANSTSTTMQPVKGALVKNSVSNSKGLATVTLYRKGTYSFKASKKNWVRSNAFTVTVT